MFHWTLGLVVGLMLLVVSTVIPRSVIKLYAKYGVAIKEDDDLQMAYAMLCIVTCISSVILHVIGWIVVLTVFFA